MRVAQPSAEVFGDRDGKDDNSGDEGSSEYSQRSDILAQFVKNEIIARKFAWPFMQFFRSLTE